MPTVLIDNIEVKEIAVKQTNVSCLVKKSLSFIHKQT